MILLVDDRPENLLPLRKVLEARDFKVDTALSGEEALKKVLKNSYALIILDVQMPYMDGFEVAEALSGNNRSKDIPIIFLSAVNTDKRFITKGYFSGGIDYITKPVDPDILLLKVTTFYRLYEQKRVLAETQASLQKEVEERKKVERMLQGSVQELRTILESLPQIAFTAKPGGRIEFVNRHWHEYSSNGHFPQTPPFDLPIEAYWQDHVQKGIPMQLEVRIKKLDEDKYKYHLLRAMPVKEEDEIIKWVGTFTDINEQKTNSELLEQKVEERTRELKEANTQLEASNSELQQFASVTSHDLKEPLRKIQVFSTIIRDRMEEGNSNGLTDYTDRIIKSSKRMSNLINDLLRFSGLSVDAHFEPCDLGVLLSGILTDLELSISEKNAIVTIGTMPVIDAIPNQLRQVFQNIISNALKFGPKDAMPQINIDAVRISGITPDAAEDEQGEYYRFTISDNGIGFDEQYLDRIFTIFQRLNNREEYEGTGIGLAIARKIVERHQGLITAQSTSGKGSAFIIVIPAIHKKAEQQGT